jgi:hypothetical protein
MLPLDRAILRVAGLNGTQTPDEIITADAEASQRIEELPLPASN